MKTFVRDERNLYMDFDSELLIDYFRKEKSQTPSFFYKYKVDSHNRLTDCFWVGVTSRGAYKYFGDVVVFDTSFATNCYNLVFAPFFGVNHHRQTIFFDCGFFKYERADSFLWLFETWMEAIQNKYPKMIITDQDPAMHISITQIFPNAYHKLCMWRIMKKVADKVGPMVAMSSEFQALNKCIWDEQTPKEIDEK